MAETGANTGANTLRVADGRKDCMLKTIAISCAQFLGFENLKEKQLKAVVSFMEGNDTFVVLLTSFGKSLIYAILPLSFDKLKGMSVQ